MSGEPMNGVEFDDKSCPWNEDDSCEERPWETETEKPISRVNRLCEDNAHIQSHKSQGFNGFFYF